LMGFAVLAVVMLVPFRMVFLEVGKYSNPVHVLLFLSILLGVFIGGVLIEGKS